MALITCSECGHQVSDKAAVCPGCGAPVEIAEAGTSATEKEKKEGGFNWWLWLPLGAIVLFFAIGAKESSTPEGKERSRQRSAIELCWKEQKRASLDSGTARFVAGTCERMEGEYRRKWNREP